MNGCFENFRQSARKSWRREKRKKKVVGAKLMINKPPAPFGYRGTTEMV